MHSYINKNAKRAGAELYYIKTISIDID